MPAAQWSSMGVQCPKEAMPAACPAFARGRNGQLAIGFASNGQCPAGAMMKFKKKLTAEN
ncbi:MAG: hypothetical protein KA767_14220 [Saprospiraceae bacterium]|nr:hypothetical protein [Saprospiraceae bacterium]HMS67270.1 hypothetical protein [Saprospiraceae bacterium]